MKFYGISDIDFLSRGEWSDPQIKFNYHTYNYYDVIDALYNDFCGFLSDNNITEQEGDFDKWVQDNIHTVYDVLYDLMPDDLYEQDGKYYAVQILKEGTTVSVFKFIDWHDSNIIKYKVLYFCDDNFGKEWFTLSEALEHQHIASDY